MAGITSATGFNKAAAEGILKDVYLGPVNDLINQKAVLLGRVQRDRKNVSGRQAKVPIQTEANEQAHGIGRTGQLPDPDSQIYKQATIPTKYMYVRIKIDGPTVADLRDDMGGFIRAVESEMRGAARTAASKVNQRLYGDGNGVLALVDGAPASGAVTIDVKQPWGYTPNYTFQKGTKYLRKNMRVVFVRASSRVANSTGHKISAVSPAAGSHGQITLPTNTMDLDNGDKIVAASHDALTDGNFAADSEFQNAIQGLGNAVSATGIYLGIDPTVDPVWAASILSNGGTPRPIDEDLLQEAADALETSGNGDGITAWIFTHALRRQYAALLRADRRYNGLQKVTSVVGGITTEKMALMWEGGTAEVPIFVDKDAPAGIAWGLDERVFAFYQKQDWNWMDDDGAILSRLENFDAVQATLRLYTEFATGARNCNVAIFDLAE